MCRCRFLRVCMRSSTKNHFWNEEIERNEKDGKETKGECRKRKKKNEEKI